MPYLQSVGIDPPEGLDFMLATHRDEDHLGGLDEVIAAGYDVRHNVWDNGSSKTGTQITQFVNAAGGTQAGAVQAMPLGHVVQLGSGATATCVAVGGRVIGHGAVAGATEENDLSVAILVRFGNFEYLTAGDLGGGKEDEDCTARSTGQANVETTLATALMPGGQNLLPTQGIEVLDVNHHGSESSTNSEYMNLLTPAVAVINTGPGQRSNYHHPRNDVVVNVLMAQVDCVTAPPALVLQTEEGAPVGTNTTTEAFCVGDVIIQTTGSGTFAVSATGEVSSGPDERLAAGIAGVRTFPLDGATVLAGSELVITEIMQNPNSVRDTAGEWFEVFNPSISTAVNINGWTIRDDGSDSHVISNNGPLLVPPGRSLVLGRNGDATQNGGYQAAYVYSGINLANGDDEIVLVNLTGQVVDRVAYSGEAPWPDPTGRSMVLQNPAADNNDPANWAESTARGGSFTGTGTDFGTPGAQ